MGSHRAPERRCQYCAVVQEQVQVPGTISVIQVSSHRGMGRPPRVVPWMMASLSPKKCDELITLVSRNVSPAEFSLKYNVMPFVGVLSYGEAARTTGFDMPEALDAVS